MFLGSQRRILAAIARELEGPKYGAFEAQNTSPTRPEEPIPMNDSSCDRLNALKFLLEYYLAPG